MADGSPKLVVNDFEFEEEKLMDNLAWAQNGQVSCYN